jgi:hypothetical protein
VFHSDVGNALARESVLTVSDERWQADMQLNLVASFVKAEWYLAASPDPAATERYEYQIPLRRAWRPEDLANAVLYLASDESWCVTGVGLVANRGIAGDEVTMTWPGSPVRSRRGIRDASAGQGLRSADVTVRVSNLRRRWRRTR